MASARVVISTAEQAALVSAEQPTVDVRALAAAADALPLDAAIVESYRTPPVSADGGCSIAGKLVAEPFSIADELVVLGEGAGTLDARGAVLRRLWALRHVCAALAAATGAEWVGIYERVPPSARSVARGGSDAAPCLLKLAYVGAPSRAYFPLTPEFARGSNNATVGLSGDAVVYHDVRALPRDAPYYVCDGAVRAEVCAPIVDARGDVIGILDAEAFTPNAFLPPAALAAVLSVCAQLGAVNLLR